MYEYSSKFLNDIQRVTKTFQDLTKNNIVFTSVTGTVVDCNTLLFDSNVSLDHLRKLGFKNYFLFPLAVNCSLSGFFILDASHIDVDFIKLCGKYIETSLKEIISDKSNQIIILDPIEAYKASSLAQSLKSILSISEAPTGAGVYPLPSNFTVNGNNSGDSSQ